MYGLLGNITWVSCIMMVLYCIASIYRITYFVLTILLITAISSVLVGQSAEISLQTRVPSESLADKTDEKLENDDVSKNNKNKANLSSETDENIEENNIGGEHDVGGKN